MKKHYNKNLQKFAREMRNDSTKAEIKLWYELLRAGKLMGYAFLRQRPIGNYIADFMCKELNLIIEVDGISHEGKENKDAERDKFLSTMGFTVLRFTDFDVLQDMNHVEDTITSWVTNNHPPGPLPKGE